MKSRIKTACLVIALVMAVACVPRKTGGTDEKLTVGCSRLRISLPVFVASHNGYFEDNGLDVSLEMFDTAQPLMDALCGGKIDAAGYTALPITFNAQQKSGRELIYATLLMEDDAHPVSMFLVPVDSPIKTYADLKGKTIGILPTFAYKAWLEMIMVKNGLEPGDYTVQHVAPAMTPSALQSGSVDAVFTNDPAATTSISQGVARLLFEGAVVPDNMWAPLPFASFNISSEFAGKNPDAVKRIVSALDKAIVYINEHPEEAKLIMAEYLPEAQKPFVTDYPDAMFVESGKVNPGDVNRLQQAYLELGIVRQTLDLDHLLYR